MNDKRIEVINHRNTCAKEKEKSRRYKSALARIRGADCNEKSRQTPDATTRNRSEKAAEAERD